MSRSELMRFLNLSDAMIRGQNTQGVTENTQGVTENNQGVAMHTPGSLQAQLERLVPAVVVKMR